MTTSSPDREPTSVLPQGAGEQQPSVTTAPPTRRGGHWRHRVPARIGRARTSTVVIGCLFVLLFALHAAVQPSTEYTTVTDANTGQTVRVPVSQLSPAPTTPVPTTTAPAPTSTPDTTTTAPRSTTTTPRSTTSQAPQSRIATTAPETTTAPRSSEAAPTPSGAATSEAPSTTAAPTSSAPTS